MSLLPSNPISVFYTVYLVLSKHCARASKKDYMEELQGFAIIFKGKIPAYLRDPACAFSSDSRRVSLGSTGSRGVFLYQITFFSGESSPRAAGVKCCVLPIKLSSFLGRGLKQGESRADNRVYSEYYQQLYHYFPNMLFCQTEIRAALFNECKDSELLSFQLVPCK